MMRSSSNTIGGLGPSSSNTALNQAPPVRVRPLEEFKSSLNTLVPKLRDASLSGKSKLNVLNQLVELSGSFQPGQTLSSLYSVPDFVRSLRPLVMYKSKALRITNLRVMKLYMKESQFIQQIIDNNMHYFIAWSMERDKTPDRERLQAFKLVRKMVEVDPLLMPRAVVQAVVGIAETKEDHLARAALQILLELVIRNPRIVNQSNGIRTLCIAVVETTPLNESLQDGILTAILYLLSEHTTRRYINPQDIRLIVAPLTDIYNVDGGDKTERWRIAKRAIVIMLKSWPGLFALASDPLGICSIIEALRQPALELNEIVLEALFEIFRLSIPRQDPFTQGKNKKTDQVGTTNDTAMEQLPSRFRNVRHNALDNFIATLLYAFVNAGVIQALIDLGNEMRNESKEDTEGTSQAKGILAFKTTVLIGELLYLSNTHLPTSQCAKLQTLPKLVNQAVSFHLDPRLRSRASTMTTYLYQYSHIKGLAQADAIMPANTGQQKWRKRKGRRLARIEEVKMKMDYKMDEQTFQQKLRETNVLMTKDYQKWRWDLIADLLRGPLTNPVHIAAAFRTKFIKRLLSFLRPSNGLFANIPQNMNTLKYARIASQMLEVLVSVEIGQSYLADNRLVPQIAEHLRLEVEAAGKENAKKDRLLSRERVLKTMAREYFTLLGTLSSSPAGLEILNKHKVFEHLSPMSVLQGRDDLSHPIMTSLDYNMPGAARILLAKSLTATSKVVRYLATRHLGFLLRSGVASFSDWGVMFLVKQLADEHGKVVLEALQVLDEACDDVECLESLITRKPNLVNLGKDGKGKEIMIRFLSRNSGFAYLWNETNLVKTELVNWRETEYINYTLHLEKALQSNLHSSAWRQTSVNDDAVYLPPHFYGELASTAKGCEVLRQSGHFPEFIRILKDESTPPLQRRAALLVIGHVGKSVTGLDFLKEHNLIPYISELAQTSTNLNLRGTCVFFFGLVSKTQEGKDLLEANGWESAPELNVCVPKSSSNTFLKIEAKNAEDSWAVVCPDAPIVPNMPKEHALSEVYLYLCNLSNHITTETASRNLKRLKAKEPDLFRMKEAIVIGLKLLESYKYRTNVRQHIYALLEVTAFKDDDFPLFNSLKL